MTATAAQDCELGFLRTLALKSLPRNRPGLRQLLSVLRVKISQTGQVSKAVLLKAKLPRLESGVPDTEGNEKLPKATTQWE